MKTGGISEASQRTKELQMTAFLLGAASAQEGPRQVSGHHYVKSSSTETGQKQQRNEIPHASVCSATVTEKCLWSGECPSQRLQRQIRTASALLQCILSLSGAFENPVLIPQCYAQELERKIKVTWRPSPRELGNKSLKIPQTCFSITLSFSLS